MSNSKCDDVFNLLFDELKERKENGDLKKMNTPALIFAINGLLKLKEEIRKGTNETKGKKRIANGSGVLRSLREQK
ncbi:hypothetical protein KAR91_81500 [Candidatus Pacearchaeota archaeon]|nr:hypothetical protein [Candidatus Pacearchaeota archaeon]